MSWRLYAARAPVLFALAALLAALLLRSSLARLLPVAPGLFPVGAIAFGALVVALLPALFVRTSPLPAAALVAVPTLVVASYGASRLDWLRVLKDFGVAEKAAFDALRFALALAALLLVWLLHALDYATRLRIRSEARGIDAAQARPVLHRVARRSAEAAAIATAGALGLLLVAVASAALAKFLPVARGALLAPLLAAALLAGVAVYLFRRE